MSENRKDLFVATEEGTATSGRRSLAGSVQLNTLASEVANKVMATVTHESFEDIALFKASTKDATAHDQLIKKYGGLEEITDLQSLSNLDDDTKAKLLRSRQSTRSHCKAKAMTMDNYRTMTMNAAGELIIRKVLGTPKTARGTSNGPRTSILFTDKELTQLAEDQNEVRREIRNLASRKSIYKHSDQFSEDSETWQQILKAEEQLKGIRQDLPRSRNANGVVKARVLEVLGDKDISALKAGEAKQLLGEIVDLMGINTTVEDSQ